MDLRWTTDAGTDPRLARVFRGVRADRVTGAVVDGVPVYVTSAQGHFDGGADVVQVWDAATGELIRTIQDVCGEHLVTTVVGDRPVAVVCDESDSPKVIDLATGAVSDVPADHRHLVRGLAIAMLHNGPTAVWVDLAGIIRMVDLVSGAVREFDAGEQLLGVSVLRLDGRQVAVVAGDAIGLWDVELGEKIGSLPTSSKVQKIAVLGNAIAALSLGGSVHVWDMATRRPMNCRMAGHQYAWDIAGIVIGDRRLVAVSDPEAIRLWDIDADEVAEPPLVGPTTHCGLAVEQDTLVTASGGDETIGIWRIGSDSQPVGTGHTSTIQCVAASADGRVVAGGSDGVIGSWQLADGARGPVVGALSDRVNAIATTPDGVVLAGGGDLHGVKDNQLHRFADGPDQPVDVDHRGEVRLLVTTVLDGIPLAITAGCDATVHITDVSTGNRLGAIPGQHHPTGIAISSQVVAVSRAFGPFQLWDLNDDKPIATPLTDAMNIGETARAFITTPEGPALVTVHDYLVRIRLLTGDEIWQPQPDNNAVVTAIAVDSRIAIARADATVTVFDPTTTELVDQYSLPYPATALAWCPDGDLIIACRRDLRRVGW